MSRYLFVTWWGGGNVTPVRVLSRWLVDAGHTVTVLGPERLRDECASAGAAYVAQAGGFTASAEELDGMLSGDPALDAVVVDFMLPELLAVAEASGRPWAPLVHTLASSVLSGASSNTTAFASLDAVNDRRRSLGLPPADRDAELLERAAMVLVAGPRAVDRPHGSGADVRYLGAVVEPAGPDAGWSPPGRPLVVASLGTTPMDEVPVLERVLGALADFPASVAATVGEHATPSVIAAPSNATVTGFVRHAAMLPHADAVVCHAGLGTVTNALTFGVPLLCLPLGRDQHDNAARVEELGAGIQLPADAPRIAVDEAVRRLLDDRSYRDAARGVARSIAAESAPDRAVGTLEALAGG